MIRLDILGVQAFVAIAELGSFGAAANCLYLSQTALSRRLKKLEEWLGVELVTRTTRAVSLTQEGSDFLPKARRVVYDLAASLEDLRSGDGSASGNVKMGCLPTLAALLLPSLLREYALEHPKVRVQVFDRSATEIREALVRSELDFAITTAGVLHPSLDTEKMFSEAMVAVCPASHPLARRRSVDWHELVGVPLISIGMLSGNRMLIDAFVQRQQLQLTWIYQVEHLATAVLLVSGGTGIAILPKAAVQARTDDTIKAVLLQRPPLKREIVLVKRKTPLSPAARPLYELTREALKMVGTVKR